MAEFKFNCPQCGQTIEADETYRGQTAECPYCGKGIVVPNNKEKLSTMSHQKIQAFANAAPKQKVVVQMVQVKCPHCGAEYEVERSEYGKQAKCEACDKSFTIGATSQDKGFWNTFFSTKGRATRGEWWITYVPNTIAQALTILLWYGLAIVTKPKSEDQIEFDTYYVVLIIFAIIGLGCILWCEFAVIRQSVRRLHDRNMSGYWILGFWLGKLIPFVSFFVWIAKIVCLGFLEGTQGGNSYGPEPRGRILRYDIASGPNGCCWIIIMPFVIILLAIFSHFVKEG